MKRIAAAAIFVSLFAYAAPDEEPWEAVNVQRLHRKPAAFERGLQTAFLDAGSYYSSGIIQGAFVDAGAVYSQFVQAPFVDGGSLYLSLTIQTPLVDAGRLDAKLIVQTPLVDAGSVFSQLSQTVFLDAGSVYSSGVAQVVFIDAGSLYTPGIVQALFIDAGTIVGSQLLPANGSITVATKATINTAPTVTACSGGTAASITSSNGTGAVVFDVGTACASESTAVLTFPAATTGWICMCSSTTADRVLQQKVVPAADTTHVTIQNIVMSTGANGDFTDGADVACLCGGN